MRAALGWDQQLRCRAILYCAQATAAPTADHAGLGGGRADTRASKTVQLDVNEALALSRPAAAPAAQTAAAPTASRPAAAGAAADGGTAPKRRKKCAF